MRTGGHRIRRYCQTDGTGLNNRAIIPDPLGWPLTGDVEIEEAGNELSFAKAWAHKFTFSHPPQPHAHRQRLYQEHR